MKISVGASLLVGLVLLAVPASAQQHRRGNRPGPPAVVSPPMKTASEMYWDTVYATLGPIRFPETTPADRGGHVTRPSRPRPGYGLPVGYSGYYAEPEPVYVPVYVPGPVVYAPTPAETPQAVPPATAPSLPPAPRRPEKFYVIPGCYAGNKPPQQTALPAGCDVGKLRVNTW
jgi:hypothetical protein